MKRLIFGLALIFIIVTIRGGNPDPEVDSLRAMLSQNESDTVKVNTLIALSSKLFVENPNEAIAYGNEAKKMSEKLSYSKGMALASKYVGLGYYVKGNYFETVQNWRYSMELYTQIKDSSGIANMLNNLGAVYNNEGDDTKALDLYLQSLKVSQEIKDTLRIVTAMINVGLIYQKLPSTHDKAMFYYRNALPITESLEDQEAIGTVTLNLGEIYFEKGALDTALTYFERSLEALTESGNVYYALINIGKVYAKRQQFQKAIRYQTEAYEKAEEVSARLDMARAQLGLAGTYELKDDIGRAISSYLKAEELAGEMKANYELKLAYNGLAQAYDKRGDYRNAFLYQKLLTALKDTLYNVSKDKKLQSLQFNFDIEKKESEINLLKKDKALQEVIIQKKNFAKNASLVGLTLILIIAVILIKNNRDKVRANKLLDEQKEQIEGLVLNILPKEVATELQTYGAAIPRNYDNVTVLFTDFKGFTMLAEKLTPIELICELNDFFIAFDDIISKFGLEKIKTIGDAYMCAGGIPVESDDHAMRVVEAGLDLVKYMKDINEKRKKVGELEWGLRIGVHTGPIVAGVVGKKKYAYDIWGNTVNIASRMESSGEVGKLNISETTYQLIKDSYICTHRGKIYAKNVGDIDMYFVDGKISKLEQLARENINYEKTRIE
ncbi:MAG: adenylate/guanylate cyclase domain-containing protein [Bacteroidales bacterium]|nr:adenylate/guanylate cyclase domain-containing protein [Bacteroidales bacterium]